MLLATESLTPRELDVLQALADGLSDKEIADQMYVQRHGPQPRGPASEQARGPFAAASARIRRALRASRDRAALNYRLWKVPRKSAENTKAHVLARR